MTSAVVHTGTAWSDIVFASRLGAGGELTWIWKRFLSQFCIFQLILWNTERDNPADWAHSTVKQAQEVREGSEAVRKRFGLAY